MTKQVIFILILLLSPVFASAADRVYLLQILEDKDIIVLRDISVVQPFVDEEQKNAYQGKDFYYNVLDKEKNILNTGYFSIYSKQKEGQVSVMAEVDAVKIYEIEIPFIDNADKIVVFNKENITIGEKEVAKYKNNCGDGSCQDYENYSTCSKDCEPNGNDGYCLNESNGICDPDCLSLGGTLADPDCPVNREDYYRSTPDKKTTDNTVSLQTEDEENIANTKTKFSDVKGASAALIIFITGLLILLLVFIKVRLQKK